jgi:hypothetical protein
MDPVKIWCQFTLKIDGKIIGVLHKLTARTLEMNANKKFLLKFSI